MTLHQDFERPGKHPLERCRENPDAQAAAERIGAARPAQQLVGVCSNCKRSSCRFTSER